MRTVIEIQHIEPRTDKNDKPYFRSHLLLDDGTEAIFWWDNLKVKNITVGELVEVALDKGMIKAIKP